MNEYKYEVEKLSPSGEWETTRILINGDKISLAQAQGQLAEYKLRSKSTFRLVKLIKEVMPE